jgi:hypothetical protein
MGVYDAVRIWKTMDIICGTIKIAYRYIEVCIPVSWPPFASDEAG